MNEQGNGLKTNEAFCHVSNICGMEKSRQLGKKKKRMSTHVDVLYRCGGCSLLHEL